MKKRLTKEQREAIEIEELSKQLSMIYAGASGGEVDKENPIAIECLSNAMLAIREVFGIDKDDWKTNVSCLGNYITHVEAAKFLYSQGVRAWTKLPTEAQ